MKKLSMITALFTLALLVTVTACAADSPKLDPPELQLQPEQEFRTPEAQFLDLVIKFLRIMPELKRQSEASIYYVCENYSRQTVYCEMSNLYAMNRVLSTFKQLATELAHETRPWKDVMHDWNYLILSMNRHAIREGDKVIFNYQAILEDWETKQDETEKAIEANRD